jgi:hypothetical protein
LQYPPAIPKAIVNETLTGLFLRQQPHQPISNLQNGSSKVQNLAQLNTSTILPYDVELFDAGLFAHSTVPSTRSLPSASVDFGCVSAATDADFAAALLQMWELGTILEAAYEAHLPRSSEIRTRDYSLDVVGLAGGFKFGLM